MFFKRATTITTLLILTSTSFAQSWFHQLIPGSSSRSDADRVLGKLNDAEIKEAKSNNLVGAAYAAFHIKGKGGNFNFAPGTLRKPESNLILTLIQE